MTQEADQWPGLTVYLGSCKEPDLAQRGSETGVWGDVWAVIGTLVQEVLGSTPTLALSPSLGSQDTVGRLPEIGLRGVSVMVAPQATLETRLGSDQETM